MDDVERCSDDTCLTCALLGPDWRAEAVRQWDLPDPTRAEKIGRSLRRDDRALGWLTDDWQRPTEIAAREGMTPDAVWAALWRLRRRRPDAVEHSRLHGYRRRRVAA